MDDEDAEKTSFIIPWGTYCYRVMPFGLKNVGATYMGSMTTMFHDMMHKEIEVYVDDAIIKSKSQADHVKDLRKFFERLRRYNLKLNPTKCGCWAVENHLLNLLCSNHDNQHILKFCHLSLVREQHWITTWDNEPLELLWL